MEKAAQLSPRMLAELIDRVKTGQPLDDLLSQYDPIAVRDILEETTAEASKNKHPFDLFEKPELLSKVKVRIDPNLKNHGETDYFVEKNTGIERPDKGVGITLKNRGDKGSFIHETQHAYDTISRPEVPRQVETYGPSMLSEIKQNLEINRKINKSGDLKGIQEATDYFSKHFKPDVDNKFSKMKQMLNLERVVKGKPLKMIAPLAIGASALGIGEKAMAGDFRGAASDTGELVTDYTPIIGDIKGEELGNAELPPEEMQKRERFNKLRQRLLNK